MGLPSITLRVSAELVFIRPFAPRPCADLVEPHSTPRSRRTDMDLVDIGANLGHDSFDRDREEVLARARIAGVAQIVITGASEAESVTALGVARTVPGRAVLHRRGPSAPRARVARDEPGGSGTVGRGAGSRRHRGDRARLQSRLLTARGPGTGVRSPSRARGGAGNARVSPTSVTPTNGFSRSSRAGVRSFRAPSSTASLAMALRSTPTSASTSTSG